MFGLSLSPLGYVGAPILMKAAAATGLMVGSLSTVAMAAPNESFLWLAGKQGVVLFTCTSVHEAVLCSPIRAGKHWSGSGSVRLYWLDVLPCLPSPLQCDALWWTRCVWRLHPV